MELISKLQPVSGLTVIASNSTMKFKDSTLSPSEIGQQLNAGSLLRGTIQQGNEQLKVIVNLVDANTQEVKWSQSFDGSTRDMLKLQGEIAQSVASKIKISFISRRDRQGNEADHRNSRSLSGISSRQNRMEKKIKTKFRSGY